MEFPFLLAAALLLALGAVVWRLWVRGRAAEARALRAEGRLEGSDRAMGLLARELEAPGLGLMGLAARLPPEVAPGVEAEARRLLDLADEVSDHAAGRPRALRESRIPLGPLLREAVQEMVRPMGEGSRHWETPPEAERIVLLADRRALARVLAQSLARAVRETRAGDRIAIRLVRAAESVALVIEDEGAGRPGGDLAGPGGPEGGGTRGLTLGLSAARALMRAHGGELTLESASGIGARTWLTLPRARVLEDQPAG